MSQDVYPSHDLIGTRSSRSLAEVIVKTLAIIITTTIAAGHLTSLRSISKKDRGYAILSVFLFVVNPVMPLASLICNFWKAIKERVHATLIGTEEDTDRTVLLCRTRNRNVQMVGMAYDRKWMGRMIVLLLFEIQAVMTAFLVVRRISTKEDGWNLRAASSADYLDGVFALGGIFTGVTSLGISLLNSRWETFNLPPSELEEENTDESNDWLFDITRRLLPRSLMDELQVAQWIFLLLAFPAMWLLFPDVASIWNGYYFLIMCVITIFHKGIMTLMSSLAKKGILRVLDLVELIFTLEEGILWARKFLDVSRAVYNLYVIYYAFAIMVIMVVGYVFEAMQLREYQDHGWWMEIMWVDPLAEKLYVF